MPRSSNNHKKPTPRSLLETAPYPAIRQHIITTPTPKTPELVDQLEELLLATWREMAKDPDLLPWVQMQLEEYRVIMGYPPEWEGTSLDEADGS